MDLDSVSGVGFGIMATVDMKIIVGGATSVDTRIWFLNVARPLRRSCQWAASSRGPGSESAVVTVGLGKSETVGPWSEQCRMGLNGSLGTLDLRWVAGARQTESLAAPGPGGQTEKSDPVWH